MGSLFPPDTWIGGMRFVRTESHARALALQGFDQLVAAEGMCAVSEEVRPQLAESGVTVVGGGEAWRERGQLRPQIGFLPVLQQLLLPAQAAGGQEGDDDDEEEEAAAGGEGEEDGEGAEEEQSGA